MTDLVVADSFQITGLGTGVLFVEEPDPWLPWCEHHVRVVTPSGETFDALAHVEFARRPAAPRG